MAATLSPPGFDLLSAAVRQRRGGHTLEAWLERTLEAARTSGTAECPVCGGRMERVHAEVRCAACGSTLS